MNNDIIIGFIVYEQASLKYLPYFLLSLKNQTFKQFKILVVDNSEENKDNSDYLKSNYPEIEILENNKNIGFAKAYNRMIQRAIDLESDYFLALNPDMILENDCLENLIKTFKENREIGAIMPKILKWDFENNNKTDLIDSLGLAVDKRHCFFDLFQGLKESEIDKDYLSFREIFGFTGAAVLFNVKALKEVAFYNGQYFEYFDELMFMYKEDCDLSYRLRLAGWPIFLEPRAVAYHDRTASIIGKTSLDIIKNRKNKSKKIKEWSFLNQLILLKKFSSLSFSLSIRLNTFWYLLKSLIFIIFFEPYLLKQLINFFRIKKDIALRKKVLKIKIKTEELENLFN
jgi:GT2 family glycosyltransferase